MKIGLLIYPGCVTSGLFAFAELLEMANQRSGKRQFELVWVGVDLQAVPLQAGGQQAAVSLTPQATLLDDSLDAILLPGFWTRDQKQLQTQLDSHRELVNKLKHLPAQRQVWAYCTAVCLLAEAGRLNQQHATSTWWLADYLQQSYSKVLWNFSQTCIFTASDATASGVNGYLPMAQELISKHCGPEVLRDIVDLMVLPKPEKTLQPFKLIHLMKLEDKLMKKIFIWVEHTPATDLSVSALAKELHQTERTLARRVKAETQLSCAQFMRLIKMNQASEYLRYSAQPISAISDMLGFSDDASFRRTFKKVSTYTPGDYRQAFKR